MPACLLPGDVAQTVRSAVPPTPSSSTPQGTGGARGTPSATPGTPVTPGTNPTAVNAHAADGSLPALSQEGAQRLVACVHRAACLRLDLTPASTLAQPQGSTAGHRAALQAQAMGPEAVDGQEEADRCGAPQGSPTATLYSCTHMVNLPQIVARAVCEHGTNNHSPHPGCAPLRLLRVTLQCGKVLAQARAANKQALLRCLDQLPPEIKAGWPT